MVKIYTSPSCSSCKKAKAFFKKEVIPYQEKNIFVNDISEKELRDILSKTENGTEDIISNRSNVIKAGHTDIDNMTISELITFIYYLSKRKKIIFSYKSYHHYD